MNLYEELMSKSGNSYSMNIEKKGEKYLKKFRKKLRQNFERGEFCLYSTMIEDQDVIDYVEAELKKDGFKLITDVDDIYNYGFGVHILIKPLGV